MIEFIKSGQILFIPLSALLITQLVKVGIDLVRKRSLKFKLQYLNYYGGMPSAHSALFSSLITVSYLVYGWHSFEFAISVIMYLVVVRDAVGIRWHLGNHGKILKQLIHEHVKDNEPIKHEKIVTRLGHTPLEATVGTICGILIALSVYGFLNF